MPILVKGLVTAEDAELAVEHGAAGVVVSNHGGRQLDRAMATADALPEVVEAVAGRVPSWSTAGSAAASTSRSRSPSAPMRCWSGGRRSGASRPAAPRAPRRVLELLREELELALALCGCASPAELTRGPRA